MARAQLSVILEDLSGTSGTSVFASSKRGIVVRARPVPNQPNTGAQQSARQWLSQAALAYKNLPPVNVRAWDQYAIPPQVGYTAFVALAAKFLQARAYLSTPTPLPLLPPATPIQAPAIQVQITASTGQIQISSPEGTPLDVAVELLLQKLPSQNRKPRPRSYITANFYILKSGNPYNFPTTPGSYAVAIRFVRPSTGEATPLTPKGTITVS